MSSELQSFPDKAYNQVKAHTSDTFYPSLNSKWLKNRGYPKSSIASYLGSGIILAFPVLALAGYFAPSLWWLELMTLFAVVGISLKLGISNQKDDSFQEATETTLLNEVKAFLKTNSIRVDAETLNAIQSQIKDSYMHPEKLYLYPLYEHILFTTVNGISYDLSSEVDENKEQYWKFVEPTQKVYDLWKDVARYFPEKFCQNVKNFTVHSDLPLPAELRKLQKGIQEGIDFLAIENLSLEDSHVLERAEKDLNTTLNLFTQKQKLAQRFKNEPPLLTSYVRTLNKINAEVTEVLMRYEDTVDKQMDVQEEYITSRSREIRGEG